MLLQACVTEPLDTAENFDHQPVLGQPGGDLLQQFLERMIGIGMRRLDSGDGEPVEPVDMHFRQRAHQIGLGRVAAVDRRLADTGPRRDLWDGGIETVFGEDLDRGGENSLVVLPGIRAPARPTGVVGVSGVRFRGCPSGHGSSRAR